MFARKYLSKAGMYTSKEGEEAYKIACDAVNELVDKTGAGWSLSTNKGLDNAFGIATLEGAVAALVGVGAALGIQTIRQKRLEKKIKRLEEENQRLEEEAGV